MQKGTFGDKNKVEIQGAINSIASRDISKRAEAAVLVSNALDGKDAGPRIFAITGIINTVKQGDTNSVKRPILEFLEERFNEEESRYKEMVKKQGRSNRFTGFYKDTVTINALDSSFGNTLDSIGKILGELVATGDKETKSVAIEHAKSMLEPNQRPALGPVLDLLLSQS